MLEPGISFFEYAARANSLDDEFGPQRYSVLVHGVGLCDEYPDINYPQDQAANGYNHQLLPGMTVCVESYVGCVGGREGVKLEQQVLITDNGYEDLTSFPFENKFLN